MMRNSVRLAAALILCMLLCGCDLWMDGAYSSVTPHQEQNARPEQEIWEVKDYDQLQQALIDLIADGVEETTLSIPDLTQAQLDEYMQRATAYIKEYDAIGAYAMNRIEYDLGTSAGKPAVALEITYSRTPSQIKRIQRSENMDEATEAITVALKEFSTDVVILVSNYEDTDLSQMIEDYSNSHPDLIMEIPQVTAAVYPDNGSERIIELTFTYMSSRDALRSMQENVEPVFTSAELYVSGDAANTEKYSQLYSFLMERYDYKIQTSITPAYSLLRHGVGDSKAFANVYAAMCRRAGLDCRVISGTREGEAWYWNIIVEEGVYYHLDLLNSSSFRLRTDSQMRGYVWDYSAYPASE